MSAPHITDNPVVRITREYRDKQIQVHSSIHPNMEARLAFSMIERWGIAAAEMDGEDSAGRAKCRLLTPDELVTRAFDVARLAIQGAFDRDLLILLPDPNEVNAKKDEKETADA